MRSQRHGEVPNADLERGQLALSHIRREDEASDEIRVHVLVQLSAWHVAGDVEQLVTENASSIRRSS